MKTFRIIEFEKLDSTSKYIKENLDRLSVFDVVTADVQTQGYGRMQRQWYDNVDNLSFSLFLELPISEKNGLLTQITALAVTDVLLDFCDNVSIKWPNDCLVNGKKIAGILIENVIYHNKVQMVVGIGLNINNSQFDEELSSKATSLYLETDKRYEKKNVLKQILKRFEVYFYQYIQGDYSFMSTVKDRSYVIGKTVQLFEGEEALVEDIDDYGKLVIKRNGKIETYSGSEISLEKIY